jgi:iron complex outermembrane recepter protein
MLQLSLNAQINLSGKIIDASNNERVTGAHVVVRNTFTGTYSDTEGKFSFQKIKQADSLVLLISHIGYENKRETVFANQFNNEIVIALKPKSVLADEIIVSAIRADRNTPTTFTQIDRKEIAKQNLGQDIVFLLDQTPNIVTTSDAGAGVGYTGMRIRGSDQTRINVTVNGIPLNDAESQNVFWVNMPDFASSVDNIQMQRGVGTSTNGAAAFGATVDLQTSRTSDSAYAELSNSFGSFNTLKNTLRLGTGLLKNKFAFDGRLSHIRSDGYIARSTSKLLSYYASGGYYGKSTILKFIHFSGKEKTYQAWWGVPEDSLATNRTYNYYNYPNETDNYMQAHYQLLLSQSLGKHFLLNAAGHYTRGKGYYEQYKGPEYNNDFGFNNKQKFFDYGLENIIIGNDTIAETSLIRRRQLDNHFYGFTYSLKYDNLKKFNATLGGAWNRYDGLHYGEIIWAEFAGNSAIGHRFYDGKGIKTDFNVFLKANYIFFRKLNVFADMQYRKVNYDITGTDIGFIPLNHHAEFHFFNPKAGLSYRINSRNNVYVSFAIGNREPVRSDFIDNPNNQNPKHETLQNLEAGYQFTLSKFSLLANYYLMNYKNQLVLTGQLNDVGAAVRTNVPESYRTGIELQTDWKMSKHLSWKLNGAYSINKIKSFTEYLYVYDENYSLVEVEQNDLSNKDISFSPRFVGGSTISYFPVKGLELSFISKYVSRQYLDNTQNEYRKLNAYFVNHFLVQYSLTPSVFRNADKFSFKEIRLQMLLNNIFNTLFENNGYTFSEAYIDSDNNKSRTDYNYYYPQAGFNFFFGISLLF